MFISIAPISGKQSESFSSLIKLFLVEKETNEKDSKHALVAIFSLNSR